MTCTSLTSVGEPPEVCSGGNLFTWLKALYYAACESLDDLTALVSAAGTPVGVIVEYGGSSAPSGWLLADGSAVSRTTYAALFAVYGTTYGSGDGTTTFNLPDKRGRIGVGKDNMGGTSANRITGSWADSLGGNSGAETHTLVANEIPAHTHDEKAGTNPAAGVTDVYEYNAGGTAGRNVLFGQSGLNSTNKLVTSSVGGGQAHNNIQPSIALNFIIKY